MGLIKHITFALLLITGSSSTNAQFLGIGASFNSTSNGINIFYCDYLGKKDRWSFDAGLRVAINTFSITPNRNNYIFYQTGYANRFWEHLSLNFRGTRKLVAYKKLRLDLMANLHIAYQSLLMKKNNIDYPTNTITSTEIIYWKPAPTFEFTLGLQFQATIAPKLSVFAASGVGIAYFLYQYESGWNRTRNGSVHWLRSGLKPNKDRGDYDFVGLDGAPMMSVGLKYKL